MVGILVAWLEVCVTAAAEQLTGIFVMSV